MVWMRATSKNSITLMIALSYFSGVFDNTSMMATFTTSYLFAMLSFHVRNSSTQLPAQIDSHIYFVLYIKLLHCIYLAIACCILPRLHSGIYSDLVDIESAALYHFIWLTGFMRELTTDVLGSSMHLPRGLEITVLRRLQLLELVFEFNVQRTTYNVQPLPNQEPNSY